MCLSMKGKKPYSGKCVGEASEAVFFFSRSLGFAKKEDDGGKKIGGGGFAGALPPSPFSPPIGIGKA